MIESFLYYGLKAFAAFVRLLPVSWALALGRMMGTCRYWFDTKRRHRVYVNLKIAFSGARSLPEIKKISKEVFQNFGQSIIELLRLPLMTKEVYSKYVRFEGAEHLEEALKQGKGAILLAMHYGSWELANLATAMLGHPYKFIVNTQVRYPKLDGLLNSYRQCGGSVVITKGMAARDFVRSLKNNEVVGIVMDQGGKDGALVPFFNRQASMADGAIRVGLKLDVPICFAIIHRERGPYHKITIHPPLQLERTGDVKEDVLRNMKQITRLMEEYIRQNPGEYMWFYKIWKYSTDAVIAILHDGRTGHLRQSQSVAELVVQGLAKEGIIGQTRTWDIVYRSPWAARIISLASVFFSATLTQRRLGFLAWFLTPESFAQIMSVKADFIISCGSKVAAINYLLAQDQQAKNIVILKPGFLSFSRFDLVILPQHDCSRPIRSRTPVVVTQGAPNLITPEYLRAQTDEFLNHFSHLKIRDKLTIGLLIGGDHKYFKLSEQKVRLVAHQLMEAAEELDAEIIATTSRRTPPDIEAMLQREFKKTRRCQLLIVANRGNIPQAVGGILGLSDIVIVSGDSISMVSEAASSGKKTIVFPLQPVFDFSPEKYKHDRFIDLLHAQGVVLMTEPVNMRQAILNLAKNKIQQKTLNDRQAIAAGLKNNSLV